MQEVIITRNLTKHFGSFTAVSNLNISIRQGEIYGFLGPNGAGKSTAIRMLCGILAPSAGSAEILGFDLEKQSEKIKRRIGYMSQKFSLYDDLTVLENLNFYAGVYNIPARERSARTGEMVEMARLAGREHELAGNLSGGWKQRLALGCAIISRPDLLFLDEPTSGVSPTGRRRFFQVIEELARTGTTVMVTTHFMDEAERCHRIAFLAGGALLAEDTPRNLKRDVITGVLCELALPDAMDKIADIEKLPYVKECSMHGSLLHVLLEGEEDMPRLGEFTGGAPRRITPSLEDVFITLARQKKKAGEKSA
ncbi:MAG: ABC transporter ATP-binding protein [Clostridia bacterium]|jgi:ABC-2 type transport system ATP-binding protein|nr:ABC transporter ATP-binding protein [Clostridia bacterium]